MTTLNKSGAEALMETPGVHACTDITGFGLLGHACEMIEDSPVGMEIHAGTVPFFKGLEEIAALGILPAGLHRNRQFRAGRVEIAPDLPEWQGDILFDPQTAGGLFIAVAPERAAGLLDKLHHNGLDHAAVIGVVTDQHPGKIIVKP